MLLFCKKVVKQLLGVGSVRVCRMEMGADGMAEAWALG